MDLASKHVDETLTERMNTGEKVFQGKIIYVEHWQVTLPNGKSAMREIVRHMGAAAIVPVDDEGCVTLVRQFRAPIGRILLEIPAGKLDGKGEDQLLAAQRELREETGLKAQNWVRLTEMVTTPGFCDEKIAIYLATGLTAGEDHPDDDEFLKIVRMPLDEALAMAARGEIADSKTLAGLYLANAWLQEKK